MSLRILIATDIQFLHRMKGNSNRIKSYWEYLKSIVDIDTLFLTDDKVEKQEGIFYYSDFLPKERKSVIIEQPYGISNQVKYEYKLAFDNFIERGEDYDYIIIPYIWLSYLIDTKPKTNAKFIIDTHDSFSGRTKSLETIGQKFTSSCTVEEEKFCLRNFDYIMAISESEKQTFEDMGYNNVFVAKYFYKPQQSKKKLGMIGSQSVHNIDALWWFYENVFKQIEEDYYLYICGDLAKCQQVQDSYKGKKNIVLYEYIWNIEDFYNMVDICINPVRAGSGLKIKNIEAISFCKPIITTSLGAQGMQDEEDNLLLAIADTPGEWVSEIKFMSDYRIDKISERMKTYNQSNSAGKIYSELFGIIGI